MFCLKCGTQLENGSYNCTNCGWKLSEFESKEILDAIEIVEDDDSIETEEKVIAEDDSDENFDEILQSIQTTDSDDLKKQKRRLAIFIVAILLAVFIIPAVATAIYQNSDSYKTEEAAELIANGQYAAGEDMIRDVYTKQAIAMKKFMKIENAKGEFVDSVVDAHNAEWRAGYGAEDRAMVDETLKRSLALYDEFENEVNAFEEDAYYLPDVLKEKYDCYQIAFTWVSDYMESSEYNQFHDALYDVQVVMLNEVDRNNSKEGGFTFTLSQLQNRVNTSEAALKFLKEHSIRKIVVDGEAKKYCYPSDKELYSDEIGSDGEIYILTSGILGELFETLCNACEYEITASQERINRLAEKFAMDDELYMKEPKENYTYYIDRNLENISSTENIYANCNKILGSLKREMLYALIRGL